MTYQLAKRQFWIVGLLVLLAVSGCGKQKLTVNEKRPRPVTVRLLTKRLPPHASLLSASVGSWKTEQVGFEVGGRVEFVAEPNTEIDGRIQDDAGKLITAGTPIGRLESERYELQVAKANADVTRAEQTLAASQIELTESLPAQVSAAKASSTLAKTEYDRSRRLFAQDAGSQGDVDRDRANYENAVSQIKQLNASTKAKSAEIRSLENGVLQAKQNLRDAQRNLEDCTLYSSFRGQIADISVVPGSVVTAGQAIATLQMMDPIKVELEVAAEESRRLQQRDMLPVMVTMPDGTIERREGHLYLIDPVADPLTRTFTLTLLVLNSKIMNSDSQDVVATTSDIWRLDFKFLPGAEKNMLFIEEEAILQDADGHYLWQITNASTQTRAPSDHRLKVRKLRVTLGSLKLPYLGNWVFQQVTVEDDAFDPATNMVIGELSVSLGSPEEWEGDMVLLDSGGQWMLRPGDLVKVDLSGDDDEVGYFVPMDAIVRKNDQPYIFVVEDADGKPIAKQVLVVLESDDQNAATSSLRRIEPVEGASLDGLRFVIEGAHYLIDGEVVNAQTAPATSR